LVLVIFLDGMGHTIGSIGGDKGRMKHHLKPAQYGVLIAVMLTASVGDTLLSRGMSQVGAVDMHHLGLLWHALFNPYVDVGIVLLIGFFACYTTALSFADLTFVMPATAFGYVVIALLGRYWLHERLSLSRCAGIALIVCAVGFVAGGPSRTEHPELDRLDVGAGPV
jgi:drug/metabolite transporter (DMT)-like permease